MDRSIIPFSFSLLPDVKCAFTTRLDGCSQGPFFSNNLSLDVGDSRDHVRANQEKIMQMLKVRHWMELQQVHGETVVLGVGPEEMNPRFPLKGDGLATAGEGHALVIKTADCQPILLAHNSGKYVAALHCGWRGNRANFPGKGVKEFCLHYGLQAEDLLAVRGPSLGPSRSEFIHFASEWNKDFSPYFDPDRKTMDLWSLTRDQLLQAGLKPRNIYSLDMCTYTMESLFFSYRRDRECGRQAGIIWIDSVP